jgi:hypothetical protein
VFFPYSFSLCQDGRLRADYRLWQRDFFIHRIYHQAAPTAPEKIFPVFPLRPSPAFYAHKSEKKTFPLLLEITIFAT